MLHVACPDCANPLNVSPESIGHAVTCPACGQSFLISEPGPKPPELVPQVVLRPSTGEDDAKSHSATNAAPVPVSGQGNAVTRPLPFWVAVCIFFACMFVFAVLEMFMESR